MSIQSVIAEYRKQLLQHEITAEKALIHAHQNTLRMIQPRLDSLYRQIEDKQKAGEEVPVSWLYEERRLQTIKALISGQIDQYAALARMQTNQLQRLGVQLGSQSAQAQLEATVPRGVNYSFGVPSRDALESIVGATQSGSPLADLFRGFGSEASGEAAAALVRGISLGQNPREIARDVEQALDIPRWRALTIARTEMLRAYREAAIANYKANDDVVSGWIWVAALDTRTCFPAYTQIQTKHGWIAIKDVCIGDEVLTHTGEYKPVVATSERPWIGNFIGIHTKEGDVRSTSEHPFLVERQGKLDWVEARNLQLGDRVFYQNQSSIKITDHSISDRTIEGRISQSDHTVASRLKPERLSFISLFNVGLCMPVQAINLKASIKGRKKEVNRIAPAWKRVLLSVFNAKGFKTKACIPFWLGFTCMFAIAPNGTKLSANSFSRRCSELLTTISTSIDNWWSSAFFRTMLSIRSTLLKNLPTTLAWDIGYLRPSANFRAVNIPVLTRHDSKGFAANRASLGDVSMGLSAFQTTKVLSLAMWQFERFATVFTDSFCSRFSDLAFSCMRMFSLMKRVASPRAEATRAFPDPSIRNGEGCIALDTNHFHSTIISQIDTHIQDLLVYNLEVRDDHSYVANGFVVHNCAACIAMHGTEHSLDEDLDGHPNCRCTKSPKTKSWDDILGSLGIDTSGIQETSFDPESGIDWFDRQDVDVQRAILGNSKYEAYSNGDFALSDVVKKNHDPDWGTSVSEKPLKDLVK